MRSSRGLRLLWAAPWSVAGLIFGALMLACGARVRRVQGTLEFSGGALVKMPWPMDAITFGHIILGRNVARLDALRAHEQVHVRQYERWGLFFVPAYLVNSAWHVLLDGDPYLDNCFERQARAESAGLVSGHAPMG